MRGEIGKLVCIWSPVLHGEGCSTLACSIGFGLQHRSGRRVLVVNKSNSTSNIEKFVEKDIEIKYSLDNLKIFGNGIRTDHILTYATQVNTGLYMIAGARLGKVITGENKEFDRLFIDRCLEGFDLVIVDLDAGIGEESRLYLDRADSVIAVSTPNEIAVDQLFNDPALKAALKYFIDERTVNVINKLHSDWETDSVVTRYKSRYSLRKSFGLDYDGDLLNACCTDKNFYSFFMNRVKCRKSDYMKQLSDICSFIAGELSIVENDNESIMHESLLNRFRRISLY